MSLQDQLQAARSRLLDLSLRNRMLNFRPTRRTTIEIVDELPGQVWNLLVGEQKKLAFLSREERPDETCDAEEADGASNASREGEAEGDSAPQAPPPLELPTIFEESDTQEPEESLPSETEAESDSDTEEASEEAFQLPDLAEMLSRNDQQPLPQRYSDLLLQTDLPGPQLQTNLLRIDQAATSALEERGTNLLYLTLGALQWKQPDDDRLFTAPLILLGVQLHRTSAKRRFEVSCLSPEAVLNPSLAAALGRDWQMELPPPPESWEDFDAHAWLEQVRDLIDQRDGWQVTSQVFLTLLSFTKYLMYADLDDQRWPAGDRITDSRIVRALTTGPEDKTETPVELTKPIDPAQPEDPREVFQVLDADATQSRAIRAARQGRSFVLQGPPGTGKSQTIANIIAQCLADGKRVLFVAEKQAALQVVKHRLDQLELGQFCLALHSNKSSRQAVTAELQRTLDAPRYRATPRDGQAEKILRLRKKLDEYVDALHKPIAPSGISPHQAIAKTALLKDVPELFADLQDPRRWTQADLQEHQEALENFSGLLETVWPPARHPMRGVRIDQAPAPLLRSLSQTCRQDAELLERLVATGRQTIDLLQAPPPDTLSQIRRLARIARRILEAPHPARRLLEDDTWVHPGPGALALVEPIRNLQTLDAWTLQRYHPDRLDAADWAQMHARARNFWASPLRWLRPSWWSDRKLLRQIRRENHQPDLAEQITDLKQLQQRADLVDQIDAQGQLGLSLFAEAFSAPERDLEHLLALAEWLGEIRPLLADGTLGPAVIDLCSGQGDTMPLEQSLEQLDSCLAAWDEALARLKEDLLLDMQSWIGQADPDLADPAGIVERLEEMARNPDTLYDWVQFHRGFQGLRTGPLSDFIRKALQEEIEPELLWLSLEKEFHRQLAQEALAQREPLARFNSQSHQADRMRFARLDRQWIADTPGRLRAMLSAQRPDSDGRAAPSSQLGILLGEIRRKRGGRSIRSLLADAKEAVQTIKPCFMMSPLSVSEYLDPTGARFDLVIFDEASQVEPADALGAIARGRQLILVGDSQQLPPTTFFNSMAGEASDPTGAIGLADMESILDRGEVVLPRLRLGWHYRSRHESLIAFSNREFYDERLVVFPATGREETLGLKAVYEPDDLYDRGRSQTNPAQARRIARAVFEHARRNPELSLGVGAFGRRQQQAILDAVEVLRRQDDSAEEFFSPERSEPFFVKNLETIQGDERDVIFLSVGYGKSQPEERLSMNFGPLNQEGGWRRLNVLVTRARRRCVVFTSIAPEDFDLSATQARGVHALHRYLGFAMGREQVAPSSPDIQGEDLSQAVFNALDEKGLDVACKVGPGPFYLDLAIRDEDRPGRYLLGIECDGPGYRQEPDARDRDRLRLQVLEQLGWRIARVWSVDWFHRPESHLGKLLASVDKARRGQLRPQLSASAPAPAPPVEVAGGQELSHAYVMYGIDQPREPETFYTVSVKDLARVVSEIVAVEGPIHRDELARRMAAAWGISRAGARLRDRVDRSIQILLGNEKIQARGNFYWPADMTEPTARRRDEERLRDADLICREEIAAGARALLQAQFGMTREDLASQTAYLLGFASTGKRIARKVEETVEAEIRAGRIIQQDEGLLAAETPQ